MNVVFEQMIEQSAFLLFPVGFAIILAPILKQAIAYVLSYHSIKQKNVELFLSTYKNVNSLNNAEKLMIEQLFLNMYRLKLNYKEVSALLNSISPLQSVNLYRKVHHYLKWNSNSGQFEIKRNFKQFNFFKWKIYKQRLIELRNYLGCFLGIGIFILISQVTYHFINWSTEVFRSIFLTELIIFLVILSAALFKESILLVARGSIDDAYKFLELQKDNKNTPQRVSSS